jgi:hypothetical protein
VANTWHGHDEAWHHLCKIPFVDEVSDKGFGRLRLADASSISSGWGYAAVIDHASLNTNFLYQLLSFFKNL